MPDFQPYRRILALVDFDARDGAVVGKAHLLARQNGAALDVLHLIEADGQFDGGFPAGASQGYEVATLSRLKFLVAAQGADGAVCHAAYGPRRQNLAKHVAHARPDLIVTGEAHAWADVGCDTLILSPRTRSRGGRVLGAMWAWLGLGPVKV